MKKLFYFIFSVLFFLTFFSVRAFSVGTPLKENLGRGLVAYRAPTPLTVNVNVSWRYLSTDDKNLSFNIYKGRASMPDVLEKINDTPIKNSTWFSYEEKNQVALIYKLKEVIDGVESADYVAEYVMKGNSTGGKGPYIEIQMKQVEGDDDWNYAPNDAVVADLDGDGEMELVIHRAGAGRDNAQSGVTDPPVIQAYKLDGTFMWEINLGINIREGAHYTQFMVYDLDGDGKAEVVCKTAEGTYDAVGTPVGKAYFPEYKEKYFKNITYLEYNENADYRNSGGYILSGPEFLTVFDGATGTEIVTTEYDPPRFSLYNNGNEIPRLSQSGNELRDRWGDNYGNRVDRFLACVAYLGGENHSVVMCRGYYTRTVLVAYDYKDRKLTRRWKFDTWGNTALNGYAGQGNHNLRVGDVDGDGFDEIIYGSMTVDHDGTGLYTTRMGHGDAIHLTDFIPERPGLEVLDVHENKVDGTTLRDAKTGEVIYQIKSTDDVGRGMGTDIDPNSRGMEWWSSRSGGVRSSEDGRVLTNAGVSMNMAAWWDGDLLRELQDGPYVTKYNYQNNNMITLLNASAEAASNNGSKANPSLVADVIGDWREEVILRTNDNKFVRIYMTTYPTDYRFHTFLEDPVYRMSVVYQNVAYNQPTHTGFYFGADLENIFPEKNILIEENTYTVNPIFNAIDYQWSTGETTKEIVLNRFDYEQDVKNEISLEMNFRGHTFKDTLAFTFIAPTGTVKLLSDNEIRLLNNPVNEYLRLFFNITGKFDIQIISLTGQIAGNFTVDASAGEVQTFDIANLNQGMYLLNISNDKQKRTIRFVKNN